MSGTRRGVSLRDLLAAPGSIALTAHHVPEHPQPVREITIITNVDDILSVGPDSIVLLGEELALGGWLVSVALRYAWERHAGAVIVSEQVFSASIIELARRFGVALFTTNASIDRTALSLARELGALEAGVLSRLDALHSRIAVAANLRDALELLSREFNGALVQIAVEGVSVLQTGEAPAKGMVVRSALNGHRGGPQIVATVSPTQVDFATQSIARAAPTVRGLMLVQELDDAAAAAPMLSFAALTGLPERSAVDENYRQLSELRTFPEGTRVVAVALSVAQDDDLLATRLGPIVSQRWRATFPAAPLARVRSGWFAFVPLKGTYEELLGTLQTLLGQDTSALGLAIGVSPESDAGGTSMRLLKQALLAARLASPSGAGPGSPIVCFQEIGPPLIRRLLPPEAALDIAGTVFPGLLADPQAGEVIAAALAYLDCTGSGTAAAARLGIHRNTLQSRLRRAAELGLDLTDADQVLAVHLILASLVWHPPASASSDSP